MQVIGKEGHLVGYTYVHILQNSTAKPTILAEDKFFYAIPHLQIVKIGP